jgi:hypothetical protein
LARRRLRWVVLVIVGVAFLAFLLWLVAPKLLVPARPAGLLDKVDAQVEAKTVKQYELEDGRLKLQNEARTTLVQTLGGAVVAVGALFTYRQLQHNIQSSREEHDLERQGQITERFTRAIDQLGNDKGQLDVTLGGIYTLDRIKDSLDDRATIAEVLTAYVRGHAPWPPTEPIDPSLAEQMGPYVTRVPLDQLPPLQERSPDVQAAVTVLGRMPPAYRGGLDLHGTDLRRADLRGAHLEGADLSGAHLEMANLEEASADETTRWPHEFNWEAAGVESNSL